MYLLKRLTAAAGARPASHRTHLSGKLERRGEITAKDEDGLKKAMENSVPHSNRVQLISGVKQAPFCREFGMTVLEVKRDFSIFQFDVFFQDYSWKNSISF